MSHDIIGFILSYVFIFVIITAAGFLVRGKFLDPAITRKIVHIGVSNWWILAMYFFDNVWFPSVGAVSFIVINYISYKKHLFEGMESPVHRENLGTVYFPISLLILGIPCFSGLVPAYVGAIGILVMGYGDGSAAIAGMLLGKKKFRIFGSEKSLAGSLAMFLVSFIVVYSILSVYNPPVRFQGGLIIALIATVVEILTPFGIDNITVPILSSGAYWLLFHV